MRLAFLLSLVTCQVSCNCTRFGCVPRETEPSPLHPMEAVSPGQVRARCDLHFRGIAIPPAAYLMFLPNIAESKSHIRSIDLETVLGMSDNLDESRTGTLASAELVGTTDSGVNVVRVSQYFSGTGVFVDLVFVRIERELWVTENGVRAEALLHCVGNFCLGDKDDSPITVVGNEVTIGPSRFREKVERITIP